MLVDDSVSVCLSVVRRTSRSRAADLSAPESDDLASQQLAYHAFIDCDLHPHYHYGRHVGRHGDDVHHLHRHQQLVERQSLTSVGDRRAAGRVAGETPYMDVKCGGGDDKLGHHHHQYEAPHSVQLVYCQTPSPGTLTAAACRQHTHLRPSTTELNDSHDLP